MKPIYFPFTFISEPILDVLSTCFGTLVVYQSSKANIPEKMRQWDQSGKIDIRIPVEGDEEKIESIFQDFKTWADHHQGSELSVLKTRSGKIPFFSENATSQIKLDIKRQDLEKPLQEKPDLLLNARLFLQIAQEHDFQEDTLRQDLLSLDTMEKSLINDLKGDTEFFPMDGKTYPSIETRDAGHYMIKERIEAWIRIMQHDHQQTGLYVTSSRAAIEHLLDNAPEAKTLTNIDDIPAAAAPLSAIIEKDQKRALTFYMIPELSPHQFFSRYIDSTESRPRGKRSMKPVENTLIGWYDM